MDKTKKKVRLKQVSSPEKASKVELVTAVLALLGAAERPVSVDELALGCHRLFPSVFSWPEYSWLPNLDNVRVTLVDVGRAGAAETLTEARRRQKMWRMTAEGRSWVRENDALLRALRARLPSVESVREQSESDLVAVAALVAGKEAPDSGVSRERVIAEAYRLFPEQFGLKGYPGWPDAAAVDHAISVAESLEVSADGVQVLANSRQRIAQLRDKLHAAAGSWTNQRRRQTSGSSHRAITQVESSSLYKSFRRSRDASAISGGQVCELLSLTLEANPTLIRSRVNMLEALLEQQERWDLLEFLRWVEEWCAARGWALIEGNEDSDR